MKHGNFDIYKEPRFTDDTVMTLAVAKCQSSVPESIISYLEADSYTSVIRNAISLGGDADTMAFMVGGISVVVKKVSSVIGTALLPDMDDFTICWLYE